MEMGSLCWDARLAKWVTYRGTEGACYYNNNNNNILILFQRMYIDLKLIVSATAFVLDIYLY